LKRFWYSCRTPAFKQCVCQTSPMPALTTRIS
jgi:hypothetical protein